MDITELNVGQPRDRIDGRLKVTGQATYAGEFRTEGLLHGAIVTSTIARGRITHIDTATALALPGVLDVFTHLHRRQTSKHIEAYQDAVAPPGAPFRALHDEHILFSGQPVALVVAESFDIARHAATLVRVEYDAETPQTDLMAGASGAYVPPKKRDGIPPPPPPRGDAAAALAGAPVRIEQTYRIASEYHHPMEPHATTVFWERDGAITVHDKIQGVTNTLGYVTGVFDLPADKVRVLSPFVGGAFGAGLRPHFQLYLAVMAALALQRSVRVVMTRAQMFSHGHRPETLNTIALGAGRDGRLQAIRHDAVAVTSRFEDYQEAVVNWSGLLYQCDNVALDYRLVQVDTATPADMRAPGATIGLYALECAMDELACATGVDPLDLRLVNYAEADQNEGKPYTSKELRAAYRTGAEAFGWSRRSAAPRSMREGRELIGYGMATGCWEAMMMPTTARAVLSADGTLEVATASADIGTGTYTILSQIAADAMGLPMAQVRVKLGDSALPESPVEGGSWTAASAGAAVQAACASLRQKLFALARAAEGSPIANAEEARVRFAEGRVGLASDPAASIPYAAVLRAAGMAELSAEETTTPDKDIKAAYSAYTHSAVFAEVRVDEALGVIRVTRVVNAVAAGRILNPKTARSQILGGVVFGIGMALHEEALTDHRLGRIMNRSLAEYHLPAHADVQGIEVIFVDEQDDKASPMGVKGLGEIGLVGTAAAIANAIYHATGKRVRDLPITLDKVMAD